MREDELALALAEGFGESTIPALLAGDADAAALLARPPAPPDVPPGVAARLRDPSLRDRARALLRAAAADGLSPLTRGDEGWPPGLMRLPDPPRVLFARGDVAALRREPAAVFVGSRSPTPYGLDAAEEISRALAHSGTTLWSGLARGVDAVGHAACLAASVPTVAVLAGGHARLYPPEHEALVGRICAADGCVLSELPPRRRARRGHFVRRNRILAAAANATVVVEAGAASGALHTARFAMECGADVHCLPGPWRSERSRGCHRLIGEGAAIVEDLDGLLRALGLATRSPDASLALVRDADQHAVLRHLREGPRPTDLLLRECGLPLRQLLRALTELQRRGQVQQLAGDLWRRVTRAPA